MNPGKAIAAGVTLMVPNVASETNPAKAATLILFKADRRLQALDRSGRVVAQFPISLGGARDTIPAGKLKIANEVRDSVFTYDPALIHTAKPSYVKADIAPGPNNPVGVVWMGLSKPHYGIHGTAEPSQVGRSETQGCVHLTNWGRVEALGDSVNRDGCRRSPLSDAQHRPLSEAGAPLRASRADAMRSVRQFRRDAGNRR